jgi:hypothetical protein
MTSDQEKDLSVGSNDINVTAFHEVLPSSK